MANHFEKLVHQQNRDLYDAIKPYISSIPDLRPQGTVSLMKQLNGEPEPQDTWRVLYSELVALGRTGDEAEQDRNLVDAINSENIDELLPFLHDQELLIRFPQTYPILMHVMNIVSCEETIVPFLMASRSFDILKKEQITEESIVHLSDINIAKELQKFAPKAIDVTKAWFMNAIKHGRVGHVIWALADGHSVIFGDDDREIELAAAKGHVRILEILLDTFSDRHYPIDLTTKNIALRYACENAHADVVYYLLNKYNDSRLPPSLLLFTAYKGPMAVLRLLLNKYKQVASKDDCNDALIAASAKGHTHIVELLLREKVNPSARLGCTFKDLPFYSTPIEVAAFNGHLDVVKLLLTDERVDPSSAIINAAYRGNREMILAILNDYRISPSDAKFAMHRAVDSGRKDIIDVMLSLTKVSSNFSITEIERFRAFGNRRRKNKSLRHNNKI
jgi:ankyrin repeat protein